LPCPEDIIKAETKLSNRILSMPDDTPAVICGDNFKTSVTHIVLLEPFKAVYKMKMFSADDSK